MKIVKLVDITVEDLSDIMSKISNDFKDKDVQILNSKQTVEVEYENETVIEDLIVDIEYLEDVYSIEGSKTLKVYHIDDWTDMMVIVTDDFSENFHQILESASNLKEEE